MKIGIICGVYLVQAAYMYVIFTTLADAKICFVFAKRQIAKPKSIMRLHSRRNLSIDVLKDDKTL